MNDNQIESLIKPLEMLAAVNPQRYRFRVLLLAALGYAYLLMIVGLLLAIIVGFLMLLYVKGLTLNAWVIKIVWIPLVLIGLILRSLWITLPVPDGKELDQTHGPALFSLIAEIKQALQGPQVDHVLISEDFNAAIVQIPRFGMFGMLQNYLVIGLPLLQALSPQEFRAVLAHEFGHLSGKHGKFSGWIYRLRQSWLQILITVEQERSYASFLFAPFLNWYAPYLAAYSFVLARAQEREADQYSVEIAGRKTAATALSRLATKDRQLEEEFWPNLLAESKVEPQAPRDPFTRMLNSLSAQLEAARAQKWFYQVLRVATSYDDTHPALVDRLSAMGYDKDGNKIQELIEALASEVEVNAASVYLTSLPDDTETSFNRLLREQIARPWRDAHKEFSASRQRLEALQQLAETRTLNIDEEWEQARILGQLENDELALASLLRILEQDPKHLGARFSVGALLLKQQNPAGIVHLEEVMKLEPSAAGDALELISYFYFQQGNLDLAATYRLRAEESIQSHAKFEKQATNFSPSDRFGPGELDEQMLATLREICAGVRGLEELYLVKRFVDNSEGFHFVVGITFGFTWRNGVSERDSLSAMQTLSSNIKLSSYTVLVALEGTDLYLLNIFRNIPGALIYSAEGAGITYLH
jgi:Zn-dependent protease with chaperone function